ncbi:hypothetical protein VHUM_01955 [Vanrija humicola]|uniref:NAD(P)-binding domain-containing protein n=1 Tax=Vanrija humicola TaxID=5417 RepID=A0A7D8ZSU0_VANHU|nr:hypothetical protein VHUM_01955 [Vanrija humicola]
MQITILGASRGTGLAILRVLVARPNTTVTLLLRKPRALDDDEAVGPAIKSGRVRVVQGDAKVEADVAKVLPGADVVLSTIGGTGKLTIRGGVLDDPTICTVAATVLVNALARLDVPPRVVVCSSMGIGSNHDVMPLAWRIIYPLIIGGPHEDKVGLEYILSRAASGIPTPTDKRDVPAEHILPAAARGTLPENFLPQVTILRPAFMDDRDPKGLDAVKSGEAIKSYFIGRRDLADWVVKNVIDSDEWVNRFPVIGY